jgi:hypothetical protein
MGVFGVWKAIMGTYRGFRPFLGHFFLENFGKFLRKFLEIFLEKVEEKVVSRGVLIIARKVVQKVVQKMGKIW